MFRIREAGRFRQVAALYSDHYRQVPLYIKCLDQGRLAALDRWLHYTVTTIDRSTVLRNRSTKCCALNTPLDRILFEHVEGSASFL